MNTQLKATFLKYLIYSALSLTFIACNNDTEPSPVPTTGTRTQHTLDSIFLYAKETYLWYNELPDYTTFNPRGYTSNGSDLENFRKELFDITQYAINPSTNEPYEYHSSSPESPKYSYIINDDASSGSRLARISAINEAQYGFGLRMTAIELQDIRLSYIAPNSPADAASLHRGDRVIKINNTEASISTQASIDQINKALNSPTIQLTILNSKGETTDVSLNMESYEEPPIHTSLVLDEGSQKIGYLCYNEFVALSETKTALINAFDEFDAANITDIVIDIRYNGGGYVETADYLMSLIIPADLNGKASYTERYNSIMQNGKASILKNQPLLDENGNPISYQNRNANYADVDFSEAGNSYTFSKVPPFLNLNNVIFITTSSTASASELVINALRPYMNVTVIGEKTYGKRLVFSASPLTITSSTSPISKSPIPKETMIILTG